MPNDPWQLLRPSFRTKLLLAMVLLVSGVSLATLYSSRLILQRSYQEVLQAQFLSQINYFAERQQTRLVEMKERGSTLAASENLRAAVGRGDAAQIQSSIRETLQAAMGRGNGRATNAGPGFGPGPPAGPGSGFGPGQDRAVGPDSRGRGRDGGAMGSMGLVRVLDAAGNVIRPEGVQPPRRGPGEAQKRFDDQLAGLTRSIANWDLQQVAYLAPADDAASQILLEVVATTIRDPATNRTLGAVILGSPMFDRAEELRDLSDILSGIWLEGQLHTRTIPEELRAPLAARLASETAGPPRVDTDFQLRHQGERFRVFLRWLNPDSPFPRAYQVKLYSLAGALRTERDLQSIILGISFLVLLVGAGVSLLLANKLTRSVRELDTATSEVLRGNFRVRVPVRSRDDVGRLVRSFNEMTDGLAQKDRYRRILNLVADPGVATQLLLNDKLPAGEARHVTVLFCDIRGFTELTHGLPPEEIIRLLNEHMTLLTQVVYEHHGVVDKFVGDLVMALFGAPVSRGQDAENATACARKMIDVRARLNESASRPLEVGIGIATGEAVAGLMGSEDRANYTVLGACVNLASRLCSQAQPSQVLIDSATRNGLRRPEDTVPVPALELKGFPEPVPAWQLRNPSPSA